MYTSRNPPPPLGSCPGSWIEFCHQSFIFTTKRDSSHQKYCLVHFFLIGIIWIFTCWTWFLCQSLELIFWAICFLKKSLLTVVKDYVVIQYVSESASNIRVLCLLQWLAKFTVLSSWMCWLIASSIIISQKFQAHYLIVISRHSVVFRTPLYRKKALNFPTQFQCPTGWRLQFSLTDEGFFVIGLFLQYHFPCSSLFSHGCFSSYCLHGLLLS